ncbi:MAG: class I SAM-dependent methyltransferase [Leptolyngbyaceae cyanobacterium bins.302]|nr:class I SAM-dependent methyltransferase [Leptolyngbyaceae cyanobacterium bins.302]
MIQVLQYQQDVEAATQALQSRGLPTHLTVQKNWDQWLLAQSLADDDRQSQILDLGCGDGCTLDFLAALGFQHLHGIDLEIKPSLRNRPYQLHEADMTATPFPDASFDCAVSISVIEHGVDLNAFFQEAYRLLRPNGLLFVTTDYWQQKIQIDPTIKPFGLSWSIFSDSEVAAAIALAQSHGFSLDSHTQIPDCVETTVDWYDRHYTFIAMEFRKVIR